MPETVDQLRARVLQLEDELATQRAQNEAQGISAEQAGQAMEQRYTALAEGHGKVVAEKEKLQRENETLRDELTSARSQVHKLQTALMQRDAELEHRGVEVAALQRDKASLDKLLQEKQSEIQETQTRLQAAAEKNVSLTEANTQLDAKLHEAQAAASRAQLTQARIVQEKEILEKQNAWLNEELNRKSEALSTERRKSHEALLDLQRRLSDAEASVSQLQSEQARLLDKCRQQGKAAEDAAARLRDVREESAVREEAWQKEVGMAQRMAQLYRESGEDRARKCTELEGVVQELKAHLEAAAAANSEALEKAEAARLAAERRVEEERAVKERMLTAAAAGLPMTPGGPASMATPPAGLGAASSPSTTELYSQLVEAQEQLRGERLKNRRQEIMMEELCSEVEKRADLVKEQQAEYERIKSAYVAMSASLEALSGEKRQLEAHVAQLEADTRRTDRERRSLEQQVSDLSRQVQRLLVEVQAAGAAAAGSSSPSAAFAGGDANDVTTQVLLEFKDIQELQQQNQRLLAVNRQLAAEAESGKAQAEAGVRAEYEAAVQRLSAELDQLRNSRKETEELLAQVVRQRNLLSSFLRDNNNDSDAARRAYAQSLGRSPMPPAQAGSVGQEGAADGEQATAEQQAAAAVADLEQQLKQLREDAARTQEMLAQDLSRAKEAAAGARTEAARARADAEFERERTNRLGQSLEMQASAIVRQQLESLMASAAKQQSLITETERRLGEAQAAADEARDKARHESMRAQGLEAELRVMSGAEQRASSELSSLSSDKFRLAAELEAARSAHAEREGELVRELGKLREEVQRSGRELGEAQRDLATARSRAEAAVRAADLAQSSAQQSVEKLEEEVRQLRESLSGAQQRATGAEAKVELLQEAVRKAEERAARLEMERNSRQQPQQGAAASGDGSGAPAGGSSEAELAAEVKVLREELAAAQEAAAAATGHAKQFELLARTSEEAFHSIQADHNKFKEEAHARYASAAEEVERLRSELGAKEGEVRDARQAEQEFAAEIERQEQEWARERQQLKAEAEAAQRDSEAQAAQASRLREEVDLLRKQYEDAKRHYDHEVMQHGDALKRYAALDSAHSTLQQRLTGIIQQLDEARMAKSQAESEWEAQRSRLQQSVLEGERKVRQLAEQRDALQRQLEKAAAEAPGEGGGDYAEPLRLLRQEREALEIQLQLTERENARLRQEAAMARQAAEEARAQLSTETERARSAVRAEQDQAALVQKLEQFNLLRESNAQLRSEVGKAGEQLRETQSKLRDAEAQLAPLQRRILGLEADKESAAQELAIMREQQERWQQRAQQVMQRFDSVDKHEHERVVAELKEAQEAVRVSEEAARERQAQLAALEQQLSLERARATQLQRQHEELGKENQGSQEALRAAQQELEAAKADAEKQKRQRIGLWKRVVDTCNKDKLPPERWSAVQAGKERRLAELEERVKALEGQQEGSASAAAAEGATLRAQISQLESELARAKEIAEKARALEARARALALDGQKKALARSQQQTKELEEARAALSQAQSECEELRKRVEVLQREKAELTLRLQALQEDLKRRAAAVAASTGPAAAARVLHAAGPAEARRELEGIRAQALADQRSKLESKRKLDQPAARQEGPPATAVVAVEVLGLGQAAGGEAAEEGEAPPPTKRSRLATDASATPASPAEAAEGPGEEGQPPGEEQPGGEQPDTAPDEQQEEPQGEQQEEEEEEEGAEEGAAPVDADMEADQEEGEGGAAEMDEGHGAEEGDGEEIEQQDGTARLEGQYDEDGDGGQQEEQQQAAPAEEEQQPTDEVDVAEGGEEELADTAQGAPEAQPGESQPGARADAAEGDVGTVPNVAADFIADQGQATIEPIHASEPLPVAEPAAMIAVAEVSDTAVAAPAIEAPRAEATEVGATATAAPAIEAPRAETAEEQADGEDMFETDMEGDGDFEDMEEAGAEEGEVGAAGAISAHQPSSAHAAASLDQPNAGQLEAGQAAGAAGQPSAADQEEEEGRVVRAALGQGDGEDEMAGQQAGEGAEGEGAHSEQTAAGSARNKRRAAILWAPQPSDAIAKPGQSGESIAFVLLAVKGEVRDARGRQDKRNLHQEGAREAQHSGTNQLSYMAFLWDI
ncbi:hypothetical protein N2152v2_002399 [Parachlorella kessleri]